MFHSCWHWTSNVTGTLGFKSPCFSWMLSAGTNMCSSPNHTISLQVICNVIQRKTEKIQGQGWLSLVLSSCFSRWHWVSHWKCWSVYVHFTCTESGVFPRSLVIPKDECSFHFEVPDIATRWALSSSRIAEDIPPWALLSEQSDLWVSESWLISENISSWEMLVRGEANFHRSSMQKVWLKNACVCNWYFFNCVNWVDEKRRKSWDEGGLAYSEKFFIFSPSEGLGIWTTALEHARHVLTKMSYFVSSAGAHFRYHLDPLLLWLYQILFRKSNPRQNQWISKEFFIFLLTAILQGTFCAHQDRQSTGASGGEMFIPFNWRRKSL